MSIGTYAELQTAVANWLNRADLTSRVPEFIQLAEARIKAEVRIREMLDRADLAIADGARYTNLPPDFLEHKYLRLKIPDVTTGLRYYPNFDELSIHELTTKSVNDARTPRYFAIHEQLEIDCEADQAYTAEIYYYTVIPALSVTSTNALLTRAPNVYLFASLAEAAPFLVHDERVPIWEGKYAAIRDSLNKSQLASRRGGPLVSRVAGLPRSI
jgi:hypothetical protein